MVRRGGVRIPSFQRPLRWAADDIVALFDSIYQGYPIGSFLLRKGHADAARIAIGPLRIDAPETHSALWVVDGQQRLTALAAGLAHPQPISPSPDDPWVVYFDAANQKFASPQKNGNVPSEWVPAAQLLDASSLSEWVFQWRHANDVTLRAAVFRAGSLIRQYRIPLYIVETDDEQLLREIFFRINKYGKSMQWQDVHDALFGHVGEHPSTLASLADELREMGMGRPEEEQLLRCLIAWKGLDVTRTLTELYRKDPTMLKGVVSDALPALRNVLSFLRQAAEIPHLLLLPRSLPLMILTRFFALHPEPRPRTRDLLVRFVWRLLLAVEAFDERRFLRHGVTAIEENQEEPSVQNLLALVPKQPLRRYHLPERTDARAADSRVAFLGMASLAPRRFLDGTQLDVAAMIETRGVAAFRRIFAPGDPLARTPANRILLPGASGAARDLLEFAAQAGEILPVFSSHAISSAGVVALRERDTRSFLYERKRSIEEAVDRMAERLAGWSRTDRPSIEYLLSQADDI